MSERTLPSPPVLREGATRSDITYWNDGYIDSLEAAMVDLINDRVELFSRCQ